MNFSAYTTAALQTALIMMRETTHVLIQEVIADVEAEVSRRTVPANPYRQGPTPRPCPTDGCPGHLEPWPKSSAAAGVPVVGCLLCRYSRMDGV